MTKYIPNTVTLLASLFGMLAVSFAFQDQLHLAGYCILLAAFCDWVDGLLARALNAKSALGADLDSLGDIVSFGVAPASIAFKLLEIMLPEHLMILSYIAFIIVPFSALRLAIFNNSTNQTTSFIGLPVPAHAMLWVGLVFLKNIDFEWIHHFYNPYLLLTYVIVFSLLLVSKLPLFGLKFSKDDKSYRNKTLWLFLIISILLIVFFLWGGLFFIILLYVGSGLFSYFDRQIKH
ncbi:CDP-diacylglycerol--serine O-phosphatidyltransferase [Balneicella halophila]|uniref:CDP-diacylglycerol--serine O-phosphatidyltransferase n=1 Tax=Balneicella halophila TaxID=1537566 RepID=A0A7L4UP79_BALHA|nr:CDP-diacylglycerol--serine O-phosphatidyltransferase [Balneicella halophila]PVX49873.1 CDP-diacylglycerol--serine O-phosphatidyltransferase [Balneicella halophila]